MTTAATPGLDEWSARGTHGNAEGATANRIHAVDIVRGLVMVLMALDHVRVYAGVPAGGPTAGVFLTRWVTHFCAPAFFFLSGTSAYLFASKAADKSEVSRWLLVRGVVLLVLELTVLRLAWTFNADFQSYMLAGVIWSLGWCMILMAILVRLPLAALGVFGLAVIAGHNVLTLLPREALQPFFGGSMAWLWSILYFGGGFTIGGGESPNFLVLYSIIPWIGVMAAGYAFGAVLRSPPDRRRRLCIAIGVGAIALFVVLRLLNVYGDRRWATNPNVPYWVAFLSTSKYPASLQFLLMTLGPTILVLPFVENARGRVAGWLSVFGRVPLFYYLLHIPAIHLAALVISLVRTPDATPWLFGNHPMAPAEVPQGYQWSLALLYTVTAAIVIALYFPSRWYAGLKARRKSRLLSLI
jgi:uncharacterized membrane protein